jgi:hypothetical protein
MQVSHPIRKTKTGRLVIEAYDAFYPYMDDLSLELLLYRKYLFGEHANPQKCFNHMKSAHDLMWPDYAKTWSKWDDRAFQAHAESHEWIGYAGPGGTGKSVRAARIGYTFYLSAPRTCRVAVTSTTVDSANARSWGYVKYFHNVAKQRWDWIKLGSKVKPNCFYWKTSGIDLINCIILAPVLKGSKDKEERTLSTLIGVHPKDGYLILVDECNFMPSGIFGVFANAKKGTSWFQAQAIANPIDKYDPHGIMCTPKDGFDRIDPLTQKEWPTDKGICLYLSPFDSPAITHKDPEVKKFYTDIGFPTIESLTEDERTYGNTTVEYWSQCLGYWPPSGVDKVVVSQQIMEAGKAFLAPEWQPVDDFTVAALDPAFISDGDSCILQFARLGYTTDGRFTLAPTERVEIKLDATSPEDTFYQVARRTKEECVKRNVPARNLGVECHGTGMGLAGIIKSEWSDDFIRIDGSNSPSKRILDLKTNLLADKAYRNKITEMWFAAKRHIAAGQIKSLPRDVAQQLSLRRYEGPPEKQKIQIESKKEFKVRLGRVAGKANKSPDEADAFVICIEVAAIRYNFKVESPETISDRKQSWKKDPYNSVAIQSILDSYNERDNSRTSYGKPKMQPPVSRGTYNTPTTYSGYKKR